MSSQFTPFSAQTNFQQRENEQVPATLSHLKKKMGQPRFSVYAIMLLNVKEIFALNDEQMNKYLPKRSVFDSLR